jgi:hypothetical protein
MKLLGTVKEILLHDSGEFHQLNDNVEWETLIDVSGELRASIFRIRKISLTVPF